MNKVAISLRNNPLRTAEDEEAADEIDRLTKELDELRKSIDTLLPIAMNDSFRIDAERYRFIRARGKIVVNRCDTTTEQQKELDTAIDNAMQKEGKRHANSTY